jgi:hypothetical protein
MTSDSDSIKDIDSLDIYKKALDNLGEFLEPSELVQSDLQNVQNQSEVSDECSDQSKIISKSSNDKKPKTSEFEEIFNRLLVIFTARDRVQKSLLSNVLENSSTVEIEIHQLDRQLRNNLRTINRKIKPKIKIDIMKSLAEFKAQRTVSSNDWWWNYRLNLGWTYSRCWSFWSCVCLGFSAVILYKIIYGLTTGQILTQANLIYNGATVIFTAISGILVSLGVKDLILGHIKDFTLSFFQETNNNANSLNTRSFFKSFNLFLLSLFSLAISSFTLFGLPVSLNNRSKEWPSKGTTFEQRKQGLNQSLYLASSGSDISVIRDNLAQHYLDSHDYENAAKEYKKLLPDFGATVELLRLHILKLDDDKNKKGADYSDYTDYLKYTLNVSYFETYCMDKEKIDGNAQGSSLLKDLANKTVETKIKGCKLSKYGSYNNIMLSEDAYQNFLSSTFKLMKMRGWANLFQGKYSQAKVDLESAWSLADEISMLLHNHIEAKQASTENNNRISNDVLSDAQEIFSDWERRKAESACLLVQSLKGLKNTNKSKKNQSLYEKQCYGYRPDNFDTWQTWTPEYYRWSQPK